MSDEKCGLQLSDWAMIFLQTKLRIAVLSGQVSSHLIRIAQSEKKKKENQPPDEILTLQTNSEKKPSDFTWHEEPLSMQCKTNLALNQR